MGDQEAMKPGFGQTAAQQADAAEVVHVERITGGRGYRQSCPALDYDRDFPVNQSWINKVFILAQVFCML